MTGQVKTEPSSDHRQMALYLRQMYVALLDSGFTEREALNIISTWWIGIFKGLKEGDE